MLIETMSTKMVGPQGALQLCIPVRLIVVDNLLEDVLKSLICWFGESVCLRVIRGAFLVYYLIVIHEFLNHLIELDGAAEMIAHIFV